MNLQRFLDSLEEEVPPAELDPWLEALWRVEKGQWEQAHGMVQSLGDRKAARIHAYLHRVEGDIGNSRYWHQQAGTSLPEHLTMGEEWRMLVELALATPGPGNLPPDSA